MTRCVFKLQALSTAGRAAEAAYHDARESIVWLRLLALLRHRGRLSLVVHTALNSMTATCDGDGIMACNAAR